MVYAGEFKFAGPKGNLAQSWQLIGNAVGIEPSEPPELFLGCVHAASIAQINRKIAQMIEYNVDSYLLDKGDK